MRKSGLQKQIASIFNDVPLPEQDPKSLNLAVPQQDLGPQPEHAAASASPDPVRLEQSPSKATVAAVQVPSVHTPGVSPLRPVPLPRLQTSVAKQKPAELITKQVKKVLYGSAGQTMDSRQKKMTLLVGVLAVVFAGVLVLTLGGVGEKKSKNKETAPETASVEPAQAQSLEQWQAPAPLPTQMRDPMHPQESRPAPQETYHLPGQLVVRGIVFSQNNPSAIVNDQIVRQGEVIDGVTVVAIRKDGVEFEQADKRWTQPVQ